MLLVEQNRQGKEGKDSVSFFGVGFDLVGFVFPVQLLIMFNHIQTRSSNLPKLAQSQETSAVTTDGNVPQRPIVFPSKKKKKKQKTPADLAVEEQKEDPEDFQFQEDPLETSMDDHVAADNGSLQGLISINPAQFPNMAEKSP